MKNVIGVFAHANAGKTTLTENLLVNAGVIFDAGRVDDGSTVTDNLSIEKARGITVRSSLISFASKENLFYLIDTPGHIDFVSEVERAMTILDLAILVISGVEKVEAQTYDIFDALMANKIPTIIFVNKLDRAGASLDSAIDDLRKEFQANFVQLYDFVDNKCTKVTAESLASQLAEVDDEIFDDYVNNKFDELKLEESIYKNFSECKVCPIFCGTALRGVGVREVYEFLGAISFKKDYCEEISVYAYQTRMENGLQNCYIKNYGIDLSLKQNIEFDNKKIKLDNLYVPCGSTFKKVQKLERGDVGIIKGCDLVPNSWIGKEQKSTIMNFQKPLYSVSIKAKNELDNIKLTNALKILDIEDKNLNLKYNEMLKVFQIDIMGMVHKEIIQNFLEERFNVGCEISPLSLIYKETPIKSGCGACSYTSCSAVKFVINPLQKGQGIVYRNDNKILGKILPKYLKQIERLVKENLKNTPFGWELTDAEIVLDDARYDSVASEPMHYNVCVPIAMMRALKESGTKLLEPLNNAIIVVPNEFRDILNSYLSSMQILIENIAVEAKKTRFECVVPVKICEQLKFELTKISSGLSKIYVKFKEYSDSLDKIENDNRWSDTRNETVFVQTFMNANIKLLDKEKKRKAKVKFSQRKFDKDDI